MRINVADLLRQVLQRSAEATGYKFRLDNLKSRSMQMEGNALVVDFDGECMVH